MGGKLGIDEQIALIAARQNGNVTTAQLHALGLNNVVINYRVKIGRLHRIYRGVYAVGRPPTTPLERATAAVLACGDRAALSHGSAMSLWGLWKRWDSAFDVTVARDRRPRGIRTHRRLACFAGTSGSSWGSASPAQRGRCWTSRPG